MTEGQEHLRQRMDRLVASAFLVAFAFVQAPGRIAADTKLDLVANPQGFLAKALSLWDPLGAAGQLQNQAYGYLFPMGPFFWLGQALALPAWVIQRLWWATILLLAWHGTHRVVERLGIGDRWSRIIAAFAYALAPRMFMGLGAISSEIWPMAVAPWILLPLLAVRPGHERRAALRSGIAVLLLGAVNAVASLATLILPLWWVLTRRGWVRARLLGWWILAVGAACAWWAGPLLLLGRYSPPFLDWIEDGRVTTAGASVTEALRGTTQWVATIGGQTGAIWPAGWATLTSRNAIAFGLVIVLFGLLGLALAKGPWTAFARGGLAIGLFLVTFGHIGGVAPPWAGIEADLLDGVLSPFRNNHKFEPVIRLPLVLGVAHGVPLTVGWLRRHGAPWPKIAPTLVVLALIGQTAVPAFLGVAQRGHYAAVPDAWRQAANWLATHRDTGRSLVLPGGNAPARVWGDPKDEPIQPYAGTPWVVRDGVPLGSAGATRILTAIEETVASGRGGAELRALLGNLAITRVVLAGDHLRRGYRTTPSLVVRAALMDIGARSVASFGSFVNGSIDPAFAMDWGLDRPVREVEILEVPEPASIAPTGRIPLTELGSFTGGPEGAARTGLGPMLHATDDLMPRAEGPVLVTDTLQRRQSSFASAIDLYGPLLSSHEPYPNPRRVHDYWPRPLTEDHDDLTAEQTVRVDDRSARAKASSSLSEPALGQGRELDSDPWRAFDGSGDTGWRSAGYDPVGQWLELQWAAPLTLSGELELTFDMEVGSDVAAVSVITDAGSIRTPITSPQWAGDVDPAHYVVPVAVTSGPTTSLRLVIEAVRDRQPTVRVLDLGAGVLPRISTTVRLPVTHTDADVISIAAGRDERPGCTPLASGVLACSPQWLRRGEEDHELRRDIVVASDRTFMVSGTALARGSGADRLLARLDDVRATTSSRWLPVAGLAPDLMLDGDPRTYWAADPTDGKPTIDLTWPTPRLVEGLQIVVDPDVAGRRPTRVAVEIDGRTVERDVDRSGRITVPATRTDQLRLTVLATTEQDSVTATGTRPMPVVIGDIALVGEPWPVGPSRSDPVVVPCGFGPTIQVQGLAYDTTVTTTRGDLIEGRTAALQVCSPVTAAAGTVPLQSLASVEFSTRSLTLDGRRSVRARSEVLPVTIEQWTATERTIELGQAVATPTMFVVRENTNPGWRAMVGDTPLESVTIDGWAQGWIVPPGVGGTVRLIFEPQRTFILALGAGGAAAVLLVVAGLWRPRSQRDGCPEVLAETSGPGARTLVTGLPMLVLVAVGGVWGVVAGVIALVGSRFSRIGAPALVVVGLSWLGWAIFRPWPAAAGTNRDLVSGVLGLTLVAGATLWHRRRGDPVGPPLDRGFHEMPTEAGDETRRGEGEDHGDPEPPTEDVQPEDLPDREHQR